MNAINQKRPKVYHDLPVKLLNRGYAPQICEKGYRNHPLTKEQQASNRLKCKVRCRIEHVFGEQKMRMKEETLRKLGRVN